MLMGGRGLANRALGDEQAADGGFGGVRSAQRQWRFCAMTDAASLIGLQVGDQLGHLEYVIDEVTQAGYHAFVGNGGYFPNLLADDCRALLLQTVRGRCR